MVLVEPVPIEDMEGNIETIEAPIRVAIEFKWAFGRDHKKILKDVKNLSKMIEEGSNDYDYDLKDGIIRVNKGNQPNHVFLFIIDLTCDNKISKENDQYFAYLEKEYPVEVLWSRPNQSSEDDESEFSTMNTKE